MRYEQLIRNVQDWAEPKHIKKMRIIRLLELGTHGRIAFNLGRFTGAFSDGRATVTSIELSEDSNWYAVELDNGHRLNFDAHRFITEYAPDSEVQE